MTLVEVIVATVVGSGVLLGGVVLTDSGMRATTAAHRRSTLALKASQASARIVRELQAASMSAEDENENGTLDVGEDSNRNGTLDANWSLADGTSANTLTYNVLAEEWRWSAPVTISLQNGSLIRTEGSQVTQLCTEVRGVTFTRSGRSVQLRLELEGTDGRGEVWTEFAERKIHVRN